MVRKSGGLIAFATGLFVSMMSFASAQYGFFGTSSIADSVVRFYKDFFGPIFAALFGQYSTDEFLFAKVLLFFLLILIISFILQKSRIFGKKKGLAFLISLIVSLLALRYLPENDLINGILLPYGTLGVALTTLLPYLIYLFFVHQSVPGHHLRRGAWVLYGIVYLVLIGFRWGDISPASEWILLAGVILVILAYLFDDTIHNYFAEHETSKAIRDINQQQMVEIEARLQRISGLHSEAAEAVREQLEDHLRELRAKT
jgi:hypothetical protein